MKETFDLCVELPKKKTGLNSDGNFLFRGKKQNLFDRMKINNDKEIEKKETEKQEPGSCCFAQRADDIVANVKVDLFFGYYILFLRPISSRSTSINCSMKIKSSGTRNREPETSLLSKSLFEKQKRN